MSRQPVIAVAFYSTWGHVAALAEGVIKGVEASGAIVKPYVIQETLSEDVLTKMHAGASLKPKYPVLTPDDLREVDGVIFGSPTRYGRVAAQLSAFFDRCGQLWATGALAGKFVTMFTSAAGPHGGHETTALTSFPFFVHQGMCYVPIGYTHSYVGDLETGIHGGAPYGASTVAASDGSRQVLPGELELAEFQGKSFATFVATYVRGKQATPGSAAPAISVTPAAKEMPQEVDAQKDGYSLPAEGSATDNATPAAAATTGDAAATPPATAAAPASAQAPGSGEANPATAAGAVAGQPKKRGGLFARCCGGRGIED